MRRILDALSTEAQSVWSSPMLRSILGQLLYAAHQVTHWYIRNARQTVPGTLGGLAGLWLARLFDNGTTKSMFAALGLPILFYYVPIILICAFMAAGYFSGETGRRGDQ